MGKLTSIDLQLYRQALRDREQYPGAFKYLLRAKKSPASAAKLARKAHARAHGWRHHSRTPAAIHHVIGVQALNAVRMVRYEIDRIRQVERTYLDGTLRHPRLLLPLRQHGSFAAWRHQVIESAKSKLRYYKNDNARSAGYLPG